jgi:hypothetical protein
MFNEEHTRVIHAIFITTHLGIGSGDFNKQELQFNLDEHQKAPQK